MAGRKFYSVTVRPSLTTGVLAQRAFAANDVLFNWTEIPVDRGSSRLVSITTIIRGTNGAAQATQDVKLYFSKNSSEYSLGTVNSAESMAGYSKDMLGYALVNGSNDLEGGDLVPFKMIHTEVDLIMTPEGGDSIYVAGVTGGAFDFGSNIKTNGAHDAGSATTIPIGDSGLNDARLALAVGDILQANDNAAIGTVKSVAASSVTLESANTDALGAGDELVCINPLVFIFGFEAA
tara:strand:- start:99 stop:803 length:705 start_codon:yes stop_codon:yes gene_type:complete